MSVATWAFQKAVFILWPLCLPTWVPLAHWVYLPEYLLQQGDSYSGLKVNFSEASDKAAIKKGEVG